MIPDYELVGDARLVVEAVDALIAAVDEDTRARLERRSVAEVTADSVQIRRRALLAHLGAAVELRRWAIDLDDRRRFLTNVADHEWGDARGREALFGVHDPAGALLGLFQAIRPRVAAGPREVREIALGSVLGLLDELDVRSADESRATRVQQALDELGLALREARSSNVPKPGIARLPTRRDGTAPHHPEIP